MSVCHGPLHFIHDHRLISEQHAFQISVTPELTHQCSLVSLLAITNWANPNMQVRVS